MEGATAEAALAGFTCILNRVHMPMRKTLTYDACDDDAETAAAEGQVRMCD
jgi:hypothetical protein